MARYLQFENVGRSKYSNKKLLHPEITSPDDIAQVVMNQYRLDMRRIQERLVKTRKIT